MMPAKSRIGSKLSTTPAPAAPAAAYSVSSTAIPAPIADGVMRCRPWK